jgi:uncharacterized protein (DUF779 family)
MPDRVVATAEEVVPGPAVHGGAAEQQVERVAVSDTAAQMLRELWDVNGPLMFHQSGGCCDGSSPMCFPEGDFLTGDSDIQLGDLDLGEDRRVPVWMSKEQYALWSHTHITIDLVPGRGAGFSLEAPTGFRFLIRSRLMPSTGGAPRAQVEVQVRSAMTG